MVGVGDHGHSSRPVVEGQRESGLLHGRSEHARELGAERAQVDRPRIGLDAVGLQTCELEQRERPAELVRDVGEELGLGSVELRQRLGAGPFLLERASVRDGPAHGGGHQLAEPVQVVVERSVAAQPAHQGQRRAPVARVVDGQDQRLVRRRPISVSRQLECGHFAGGALLPPPRGAVDPP
jgi:hypothetical protein